MRDEPVGVPGMLSLANVLFTIAGLLVLIGVLQPLAARLNLPSTVLLAVVGVFIGVAATFLLQTTLTDAFNGVAELILDFPISSTEFLYIFLPILLFEASLMIDVRRIAEDAAAVFVLAVIAVLVTTAVVGAGAGAAGAGAARRLPAVRGDHRDHRSVGGGRDLSRYRRARAPQPAGRGREPAQRRHGDRDLHGAARVPDDRSGGRAGRAGC